MSEKHEYPSGWQPGSHWAVDESWRILDMLRPGALDRDLRAFLAGLITSALVQERNRHQPQTREQERRWHVKVDRQDLYLQLITPDRVMWARTMEECAGWPTAHEATLAKLATDRRMTAHYSLRVVREGD